MRAPALAGDAQDPGGTLPRSGAGAAPAAPRRRDLLRLPVLGPFLRWRHARTAAQSLLLALAALLILDGIFGPQLAPRNLAGVLPWVHWRGFVILGLLVLGNVFCFACPFMLPRRLAKHVLPANRPWPSWLRNKWLAVALLLLFFWAYEAFSLWSSPLLTAWVALTYFAGAFVVDGFFRGAAFCKHVCPIGQFNFVNSLVSPTEVAVRDPAVCTACRTKDCITGRREGAHALPPARMAPLSPTHPPAGPAGPRARGRLLHSGCELYLFQERKVGNLDCTFCLECLHACPHGNIGVLVRAPGREIWNDDRRSGVGRLTERGDLAALALLLTFGAFVNAFGMVAPVHGLQAWLVESLGLRSRVAVTGVLTASTLVVLPALLVGAAGILSRAGGQARPSLGTIIRRYSWALVPVGVGMWAAHYLYHFLLSGMGIVPLVQAYLGDLGVPGVGPPAWGAGALIPEGLLFPLQLVLLELGLLVSWVVALRIARREGGQPRRSRLEAAPWMGLALLLSLFGLWLLFQPMEMRGGILL